MAALKNRFSSEDVKWRLRQSLSALKQGRKESLDSYIEFIKNWAFPKNTSCTFLSMGCAMKLNARF